MHRAPRRCAPSKRQRVPQTGIIHGNNTNEFKLDLDESTNPLFSFDRSCSTDQATDDATRFLERTTTCRNQGPRIHVDGADGDFRV